jgi:hypothetical protein
VRRVFRRTTFPAELIGALESNAPYGDIKGGSPWLVSRGGEFEVKILPGWWAQSEEDQRLIPQPLVCLGQADCGYCFSTEMFCAMENTPGTL